MQTSDQYHDKRERIEELLRHLSTVEKDLSGNEADLGREVAETAREGLEHYTEPSQEAVNFFIRLEANLKDVLETLHHHGLTDRYNHIYGENRTRKSVSDTDYDLSKK